MCAESCAVDLAQGQSMLQAASAAQPALGHSARQSSRLRAALQRLHEAQLAEADSYWALSLSFFGREVCVVNGKAGPKVLLDVLTH